MRCPTCGRDGWDPEAELAARVALEKAFVKAHLHIRCPACRKRLGPSRDSIDAGFDRPTVQMHCRHCGERFEIAR